jgi:hypothetical protein
MLGLSEGYCEIFYLHWSPQPALPGVMFITRGLHQHGAVSQSMLIPAAIVGAHFAISLSKNICKYSGDRRSTETRSTPSSCMLRFTAGSFIASFVAEN